MVVTLNAERHQSFGCNIDLGRRLGEAVALVLEYQRLSLWISCGHSVRQFAEPPLLVPFHHRIFLGPAWRNEMLASRRRARLVSVDDPPCRISVPKSCSPRTRR